MLYYLKAFSSYHVYTQMDRQTDKQTNSDDSPKAAMMNHVLGNFQDHISITSEYRSFIENLAELKAVHNQIHQQPL